MTPAERRSAGNGIWLCQTCAKLIDSDVSRFSADKLRKWRDDAVQRAFRDIVTAASLPRDEPRTFQLDDADRDFLRALVLPAEDDIESVTARMFKAAANDLASFRASKEWPAQTLALHLTLPAEEDTHPVTLEGLASSVGIAAAINLVSDPGTGKTTTLVQLGERLIDQGRIVPALVPLGEWSDRSEDLFSFLCGRNAFRALRPQNFMQAGFHGRLAILLDGWNELDPDSRLRAIRLLEQLQREYPLLGVVMSSRAQPLPFPGALVQIQPLSPEQQLELGRAMRGEDGAALVDRAWRTPGLRDLIAIPLYLNALLATPGTVFPQTKEEVLRRFVQAHERAPVRAQILENELFGFHRDMLTALGVQANRVANTALSATDARHAIADEEDRLTAAGQLRVAPQPGRVLDVLTSTHTLVRTSSVDLVYSFQHQQFQEWYASFHVEELMQRAYQSDSTSRQKLRVDILNWPSWEESILFACERLSRRDIDGARAVAAAILDALGIDPMLAAEMIYRSTPEAWVPISETAIAFARRWHELGKVDRAVRFMIETGRPEFAPQIWPLVESENNQVYLHALRMAPRFRPSVLGDEAPRRLSALPETSRGHVIAEIAHSSGHEGIELATSLAKIDPNPGVVVDILESLQFRRANGRVAEILRQASDEVWQLVAEKNYPNELADPSLNARLTKLRRAQLQGESDPIRRIYLLTIESRAEAMGRLVQELIESTDFPMKHERASGMLDQALKVYPEQTTAGLLTRLTRGLELPFRAEQFLQSAPAVDDGPIVVFALDHQTPERTARVAFSVIGPRTVGALLDELFGRDDGRAEDGAAWSESERKAYWHLRDAIQATRDASFFPALLERAASDQPHRIRLMADLLARRGEVDEGQRLKLTAEMKAVLTASIEGWISIMLTASNVSRHDLSDVVRAAGRLGSPQFVDGLQKMLERDLSEWGNARDERARSPRPGALHPDVTRNYTLQYQRAFAAIGGPAVVALMHRYLRDLNFGASAAATLLEIWETDHPSEAPTRRPWRDFSQVLARRRQRQEAHPLPTCDFAEAIFAVVREFGQADQSDADQRHAFALARIGLGLPHGSKGAEIEALLALSLPYSAKQGLLTSAAMAGEILSADMLIAAIRELLETATREPWRLQENYGELNGWLVLVPFSDRPTAIIEVLELLPEPHRQPWQLRELFLALGQCPDNEGLPALVALARYDARIADQYEWFHAITALETEDSAKVLLELVADGTIAGRRGGIDTWHLSRRLARVGAIFPSVQHEMRHRYEKLPPGAPKSIFESAIAEHADADIVLAMISSYAMEQRPFGRALYTAISNLAVGRRPAQGFEGAYEEFCVPLVNLRKQLFDIVNGPEPQATLAEACLLTIDGARDEHGHLDGEPRHPDIESGRPWPNIERTP